MGASSLNWCFPKIGLSLYLSFATFRFRSSLSFCLLLNLFVSALRLSFLLLIFAVFFFDHLVSSLPNMLQTCSKHSTSSQDDHLSVSLFPLSPFPFAPHFRSVVSSFSLSSFRISSLLFSSSQCSSLIIASPIPVIGHVLHRRLGDVVVVVIINPLLTRFQ